jgi:hypothetical protein
MIVFKEIVDEDKYLEIILSHHVLMVLEKFGAVFGKQVVDGEVTNLAVRIDNFEKNNVS